MSKYIFLFLLCAGQLFADTITALEYSWDSPAPAGTGTPLTISNGALVVDSETIPVTALSYGLHKLYLRAYDDSAGWGQPHCEWVFRFAPESFQERNTAEFEYWFDNGTHVTQDVSDNSTVNLIRNVGIDSLSPGLHALYFRSRDEHGNWGQPSGEWVYKHPHVTPSNREILELQVWFDNGTRVIYDVPDLSTVTMIRNIGIDTLTAGLHTLNIRARDNFGVWGQPQGEWVYKFAPENYHGRVVAEFETWFDNGSHTTHDVPDGTTAQLIRNLPIATLTPGLHVLNIRCRHQSGEWGQPQGEWVYKFSQPQNDTLNIVQAEIQIDSNTPQIVDVTDSSQVNFLVKIPGSEIGYLMHTVCVKVQDERGIWSARECKNFFVIPGNPSGPASYIAGAELFINADPGEGNGVALLPDDGIWDEPMEAAHVVVDSVPMGIHKVGVRVKDDLNQWSNVVYDTVRSGPLLVIHTSGTDVILNWERSLSGHEFEVWRSALPDAGYISIATTTDSTYTDPAITSGADKRFYHVSFTLPPGLSEVYRLPAETPLAK